MNNPLYTAEIIGSVYQNNVKYKMVEVIQWSDNSDEAKEINHKIYYFNDLNSYNYLMKHIKDDEWCNFMFTNYNNYQKFTVKEIIEKC